MALSPRDYIRMMKQATADYDAEVAAAREKLSAKRTSLETVWKMQNPRVPLPNTTEKKDAVGKGELTDAINAAIDTAPTSFSVRDIEPQIVKTIKTDRATISSRLNKIVEDREDVEIELVGKGRRPTQYRKLSRKTEPPPIDEDNIDW